MGPTSDTSTGVRSRLCDFLDAHHDEIVARWSRAIQLISPGRELSEPELRDHLPQLLKRIARYVGSLHTHEQVSLADAPKRHAVDRLSRGFNLEEVMQEFGALRRAIIALWTEAVGSDIDVNELARLDDALDIIAAESSARYAFGRERSLRALDRITEAALGAPDLDVFLKQLLDVTVEMTESVDTAAVLLVEEGVLRLRAAVGIEHALAHGFTQQIGEGFAGTIAKTRAPLAVRDATLDDVVTSSLLKHGGVRALFGVPLVHKDELIGVAHMGSRHAYEFSDDDTLLFRTMASRATAVIVQATLVAREKQARAEAERALRLVDALLQASPVGIAILDDKLRYLRVNEALAAMNRQPVAAHIGKTIEEIIPDVAEMARPIMEGVLAGNTLNGVEIELPEPATSTSAGSSRWFVESLFPVRDVGDAIVGVGAVVAEFTARKRAEQVLADDRRQLEQTKALLELLLANAPVGFAFVDEHQRYRQVNQALADAHGVSIAEHLGKTPREVLPARAAEEVEAGFRAVQETQAPVAGRMVSDGDGRAARHWLMSYYPLNAPDGRFIGSGKIAVDITERTRAAEDQKLVGEVAMLLADSLDIDVMRRFAEKLVPRIADWVSVDILENDRLRPIAVAHRDAKLVELVRRMRAQYTPPLDAPMGVARVMRTGRSAVWEHVDRETLAQSSLSEEHLEMALALDVRSVIIAPMIVRGRAMGAVTFVNASTRAAFDETDRALADDLAARAALAADNAMHYRAAGEAARMREEILAVVSHDLKTPLNAIGLSVTSIRRHVHDAAARRTLDVIQRSSDRMNALIHVLLDMASIQAGRLHLSTTTNETAASLVRAAVELHEPLAAEKGVALEQQILGDDCPVVADGARLQQVFANLIGNAIKFCRARDVVRVRADATRTDVVVFSVVDTGAGISDEELPHIFEPYWSARRFEKKGTGLGLYIAKGIVEAHGGAMSVESAKGRGASFSFTIKKAR